MISTVDELSVRNSVIVRPKNGMCHPTWANKNFRYEGTVRNICNHYINRGAKEWGKETVAYISFIDTEAYNNLLLQGSNIMCYLQGVLKCCYIITIVRDSSNNIWNLEVSIYDDEYNIANSCPDVYIINLDNIESMLITDKGYNIQKV